MLNCGAQMGSGGVSRVGIGSGRLPCGEQGAGRREPKAWGS